MEDTFERRIIKDMKMVAMYFKRILMGSKRKSRITDQRAGIRIRDLPNMTEC
jgi:hypothetical protein